ncbi:MAG: ATP-binding protein [Glaciecola sp.]|nr:ATP-binding protein [Glaciecola sp.]MDG2099272.1 ATP-binding protein [Glaciecola sp.]
MKSIQRLISLLLVSSIILVITLAVVAGYKKLQDNTQALYDAELQALGQSVLALNVSAQSTLSTAVTQAPQTRTAFNRGDLALQVWQDELLVFRSNQAPDTQITSVLGYSETNFNYDRWRVLTLANTGKTVIVGYSISDRAAKTDAFITSAILPFVLAIPVLGLLIFTSVRMGLRPLKQLAALLSSRALTQLDPITLDSQFSELEPVVSTINQLLAKIQAGLEREQSFSGNVAHELRTPLSILAISLQNAMQEIDSTHHPRLRKNLLEVNRLTKIVNQLLLLSQTHPDQHQIKWHSVAVEHLMQDVISEVYPKLLDKQQNIELQCDLPNDFAIESESELLSTIFTNLIHNANKYADNHSDILVTLGLEMSSEPTIKICVENQGEPLDKQLLTQMSERFYRAPLHKHIQGAGLGLALVKQIVDVQHGDVQFSNSVILGGLCVDIRLPVNRVSNA